MADTDYTFHPLCEAYPRMSAELYAAREDDYRRHPERAGESEVLMAVDPADGVPKIVDGRHHYLLCRSLGYDVSFRTVDLPPADLVDLVKARNANRRHQTPSQIAASLAATSVWLNLWARGGDRGNQHTCGKVENSTLANEAKEAGIGRDTLLQATKATKADPKLNEAVRDGKVSASTAAKVADLPQESRDAVTSAPDPKKAAKDELRKAAAARDKAIRKAIRDNPDATPKQIATAVGNHCTVKHVEAIIAADKAKAAKKEAAAEKPAEPTPDADAAFGSDPLPEAKPDEPPPDPRFMPNAATALAAAAKMRNWRDRLRAIRTEMRAAFKDKADVLGSRIKAGAGGQFDATLGELIETLDTNLPELVCPTCCGTGTTEDDKPDPYCDGYGMIDRGHHSGLKAKWKHTRTRLSALTAAAEKEAA